MKITTKATALILLLATLFCAFSAFGCQRPEELPEYTVNYYDEDGTTLLESRVFKKDETITYPQLEKEGHYPFWNFYDLEGNSVAYNGYIVQDMKLVLYFVTKDCSIVLIDQVTGETLYNQYHNWGDTYKPEGAPEHPGYIFKGYAEGDSLDEYKTEFAITDSMAIYAVYDAISYTVTYIDDLTSTTLAQFKMNYGELTLPGVPAKDGYALEGWYIKDGANLVRVGTTGDTYLITKDTVLFAKYIETATE